MGFLVDQNFCPLHNQYKYMWFAKMKDGSYVYEYDDRRKAHWTDVYKDKYVGFVQDTIVKYAQEQQYYFASVFKDKSLFMIKSLLDLVGPGKDSLKAKETLYDSINTEDIEELGLIGCGNRVYFNRNVGTFKGNGFDINLMIEIDGTKYEISGKPGVQYTRLHERHEMIYSFSMGGGDTTGQLSGMTVGYSGKIADHLLEYDILYTIPAKGPHVVRFIGRPEKEMNVTLHLLQGENDSTLDCTLDPNTDNEYSILIQY